MLRVGTFKIPENAKRVAESLEERSLQVRTDLRDGGLHVVMLGPIAGKGAAEDAARSVRDAVGLVPQVLRQQ
jgi:hypothetical protein